MSARPVMVSRSGPAFRPSPPTRGPVIEMTAHPDDGGHRWGWYPATPEGLLCVGSTFVQLKRYGYRHPLVCSIEGKPILQAEIETAVIVPFARREALRRAAALLRSYGITV